MYRILVFGMTENPGGVESFLRNYISVLSGEKLRFDFLCNFRVPMAYESEMQQLGSRVFYITARSQNFFQYKKELKAFFEKHASEYDCIWVNVSSLANIDYLKLAKKYNIPRRIIHSHNSRNMDSALRGRLHAFNKRRIGKWATDFWACSEEAAKWFYPSELSGKVVQIHNAISVERMRYTEEGRKKHREQLNCETGYLLGNIGRLHFQKNQEFLLKVFAAAAAKLPDADLVLIGQGEDETKLKGLAEELKISDRVKFVGVQSDIPGWLSAMDLFVFPSLFEGMPIAALEAQANGVPILASDTAVPKAGIVNENCRTLSLNESVEHWAEVLADWVVKARRESEETIKSNFRSKGYDITAEAEKVESLLYSRKK